MELSFTGVFYVAAVAVLAPVIANLAPRLRMPAVALEIVVGIAIGPSLLDLVRVDVPLSVLSTIGLAYLLFLAGLELELSMLRGRARLLMGAWALSCVLALTVAEGMHLLDLHDATLIMAVALVSTSLGLVVPILREAGHTDDEYGQYVMAASSIGEFGSLVLLSLLFSSDPHASGASAVFLLGSFAVAAAILGLTLARINRSPRVWSTLERMADTSSQLSVRAVIVVLLAFLVVANRFGLEAILGTFVAGALLRYLDRDGHIQDPRLKSKIEAIGYGFLVPIFFVTSGVQVDVRSLFEQPRHLVLVPALLVGLLICRGTPALLYRRLFGTRRAVSAGLLQATTLSFMVIVAKLGQQLHNLDPPSAAALVAAGVGSVVLFPPLAVRVLPRSGELEPDWDERVGPGGPNESG